MEPGFEVCLKLHWFLLKILALPKSGFFVENCQIFSRFSFFLAKSIAQKLPNSDPGSIFAWTFGWRNPEIKMCFPSRDIWHLDHQKMAKIEIWTFLAVFEVQYFDNRFRTCYQTWCPKGFRREQQFPAISFKIFKDPAELWRNWTTSRKIWHFEELGTLRIFFFVSHTCSST